MPNQNLPGLDAAHRPTVLIVDDEPFSCLIVGEILGNDFQLITLNSASEVLARIDALAVDLFLIDIQMPDMDGYKLCRRLKANARTRAVPVIFLTGLSSEAIEEEGFAIGAVDYVTKPPTPSLLRARINTQIQLYRAQEELARHAAEMARRVEEKTHDLHEAHAVELRQARQTVHLMTELESLVQLAPVGIAQLREGRFVRVNSAFKRMLGYNDDELIGQAARSICCNDRQYDQIGREASPFLERGEHIRFETELKTKAGHSLWVLGGFCSANPTDPLSNLLLIIQDISERRQLEAGIANAAERTQALCQANAEFLAILSHALRTPLQDILDTTQRLEAAVDKAGMGHLDQVDTIRQSGEHLLAIISQMLKFTSIDARPPEKSLARVSILILIALQLDRYQARGAQKGLAFQADIDALLQRDVVLDNDSLEALLDILLDNALKFTDAGSIHVKARLEKQDSADTPDSHDHWLVCNIEDTGIGMTPETLDKIFTPFFQGEGAIPRHPAGVGLGLTTACKLVDRLGGTIAVTSQPGQGSTFSFRMPLRYAQD